MRAEQLVIVPYSAALLLAPNYWAASSTTMRRFAQFYLMVDRFTNWIRSDTVFNNFTVGKVLVPLPCDTTVTSETSMHQGRSMRPPSSECQQQ